MSWRTTVAGFLAGLSALAQIPILPPIVRVVAIVVGAVALGVLGAVSRDHAATPVGPLTLDDVRAELARMLARVSTVPSASEAPSEVVRDAAERVLLGSDPPGAAPVLMPLADAVEMARKEKGGEK